MNVFDTKVQHLKYKVAREVAKYTWDDTLERNILDIPKQIIPGKVPTMRCCVYKERAILSERVKIVVDGVNPGDHIIQVVDIACDECPAGGYSVTESCRGCIAHRCENVCPRKAITFDEHQKASIDKSKCVNCGRCAQVCPYSAIVNRKRPCENACKLKAISMAEDGSAQIDYEKCIACGACVYQCPFGAIMDKSFILSVVRMLKSQARVYAIVAPSIASQFSYAKLGQVLSGLKVLGFYQVQEVALGADMVADQESRELEEKGFLMSSCCPAFAAYVREQFPTLQENLSECLSPMATIAKKIKEADPEAKVVFIGPCTAKKEEIGQEKVEGLVDSVLTFEELQALFDSRALQLTQLEETKLDTASTYGRIFARSGGLTKAIAEGLKEHHSTLTLRPISCSGLEECRATLTKVAAAKAAKKTPECNFIEGMACVGGCINGAGCLTHSAINARIVDQYGEAAGQKTIHEAISQGEIQPGS